MAFWTTILTVHAIVVNILGAAVAAPESLGGGIMLTVDECLRAMQRKCLDCCGGTKEEVLACAIVTCPLYPYRRGERQGNLFPDQGQKRQGWEQRNLLG